MKCCKIQTEISKEVIDWMKENGCPVHKVCENGVTYYTLPPLERQYRENEMKELYSNGILDLRVNRLRKTKGIYRTHDLEINLDSHLVLRNGKMLHISKADFIILQELIRRPKIIVAREVLLAILAHEYNHNEIQDNTLTVHIGILRRTLGRDYVKTYKTRGYYWAFDVERID